MEIKKLKHNFKKLNEEVKILKKFNSEFVILDDNSYSNYTDIEDVSKEIKNYKFNVDVIRVNDVICTIFNYLKESKEFFKDADLIIAVGEGGSIVLKALNEFEVLDETEQTFITWSRKWNEEYSDIFITDIEKVNVTGKNIILVEDVIATGETLYNIVEKIKQMGGEVKGVISALISGQSPIKDKSFCKMIIGMEINSKQKIYNNPFWYPPIYSLRHLFYGDKEMPCFYKTLNQRYFNNETKVEKLIKMRRK